MRRVLPGSPSRGLHVAPEIWSLGGTYTVQLTCELYLRGSLFVIDVFSSSRSGKGEWMMRGTCSAAVILSSLVWNVGAALAQAPVAKYDAVNVGYPNALSTARSLNNSSQVVGTFVYGPSLTRVYQFDAEDGVFTVPQAAIDGPYAVQRSATINDVGTVAFTGFRLIEGDIIGRGVLLSPTGEFTEVDPITGLYSEAAAVNNLDHIVGRSDAAGGGFRAFIYSSGQTVDLGQIEPPFGLNFTATDVNDSDVVVGLGDNAAGGRSGFMWNGSMNSLGDLIPVAINNTGAILATRATPGLTQTIVEQSTGLRQVLNVDWAIELVGSDINDADVVVGLARKSTGETTGFVSHGTEVVDLNQRLSRAARRLEVEIVWATAINNSGYILASDGVRPWLLIPTVDCAADFNDDGGVTGLDVEAFMESWVNAQIVSDVNDDGGVDGSDLEAFFTVWMNGGC